MKTSIIKTFRDELHPEVTVHNSDGKQISEHIVFRPSTNSIQVKRISRILGAKKRIKLMNAVKVVVNVIVNVRGNVEFERDITIDKFFEL